MSQSISDILQGHFDIGGRRLYLDCRGQIGPTVVIEVGLGWKPGTENWGWFPIRDALLLYTRVCLYDRAGQGRSDPAPQPLTIANYAEDLHALLHAAALPPPYILVGSSIGGLIVWLFGTYYPNEVEGIVMVDSAHPEQWDRMLALLPPESAGEHEVLAAFRRTEIQEKLDPATNEERMDLLASIPQFRGAKLGSIPLIVLTAGRDEWEEGFPKDVAVELEQDWVKMQKEIVALSTHSVHLVAEKSGHCIHNDEPNILLDAILRLVGASRKK